jgi:hypothetical protein
MTSKLFQSTIDAIAPIIKSSERLGAMKAQIEIIQDLGKLLDRGIKKNDAVIIAYIINRIEKNNGLPITDFSSLVPSPDVLDD